MHMFYTNLPVRLYRSKPVLCTSAFCRITVVSVSVRRLMACFYLNLRARRKRTLPFFVPANCKTNKQTSLIHLSVLTWPFPRCCGVRSPCSYRPEGLCVVLLPGWSMACLWCWDEMARTTQPQRESGGRLWRRDWALSRLGKAAVCTCCRVFLGQTGGRASRGRALAGSWGLFLNLDDIVWACVTRESCCVV